jgi:hypothetical protein
LLVSLPLELSPAGQLLHYTIITMKNKTTLVVRRHRWDVLPQRARAI